MILADRARVLGHRAREERRGAEALWPHVIEDIEAYEAAARAERRRVHRRVVLMAAIGLATAVLLLGMAIMAKIGDPPRRPAPPAIEKTQDRIEQHGG